MRVAVLGGGLQGACVALELASRGVRTDLYERERGCLLRASAHNEGKIHLGYVYAQDRSLRTAALMIRGALQFETALRKWVGDAVDRIPVSRPFVYLVHKDGLISTDDFLRHATACQRLAVRACERGTLSYFGQEVCKAPHRIELEDPFYAFDPTFIAAAFATPEISIDPEALCAVVRLALDRCPEIAQINQATVADVSTTNAGIMVRSEIGGTMISECYDHVVNALWDGRLRIDASMAILPPKPWSYRMKYFVRTRTNGAPLPSATIVLGPFGDIAQYPGAAYLSWYPVGRQHWSFEIAPPHWPDLITGDKAEEMWAGIVQGLAGPVPGVDGLGPGLADGEVKGGIIYALGTADIDEPSSALHNRYAIGVHSDGHYHSIDTGKLTMAPYFALQVCDRITADDDRG